MTTRLIGDAFVALLPETDDFSRAYNARLRQGMAQTRIEEDGTLVIESDEAVINDLAAVEEAVPGGTPSPLSEQAP